MKKHYINFVVIAIIGAILLPLFTAIILSYSPFSLLTNSTVALLVSPLATTASIAFLLHTLGYKTNIAIPLAVFTTINAHLINSYVLRFVDITWLHWLLLTLTFLAFLVIFFVVFKELPRNIVRYSISLGMSGLVIISSVIILFSLA